MRLSSFGLAVAGVLVVGAGFVACGGTSSSDLAAPTNLTASPMAGGVHLVWNDRVDGEEGFEIERKAGGSFEKVTTVAFDTNQFHDETVASATTYTYRVRAFTSAASSAYSNEATVTTPAGNNGGTDAGTDAGTTADAGTGTDAGTATISFRTQVVPIILQTCGTGNSSCHSRAAYAANSTMDCRGWLALEDAALGSKIYAGPTMGNATGCPDRTLHERLSDLAAWMCNPNTKYVVPGQPDQSLLYTSLGANPGMNGACKDGAGMPLARMPKGVAPLPAADIDLIKKWIEQGAKDN